MAQDKSYPITRTLRVDAGSTTGSILEINAEQYLSKANRRLYRQARKYRCKIDMDPDSSQVMHVYALADTWMAERALKMGYANYLENSSSERDGIKKSNLARWEDFRVLSGLNAGHSHPSVFIGPPFSPSPLTAGEFENTIVVDNLGVARNFTWARVTTPNLYSMLMEYDQAGNAQPSPDTSTSTMPYDDLMADDSQVLANALQVRGNTPPYLDTGVQGQWVKVGVLQSEKATASSGSRLSTGFFDAPCGIIAVVADTGSIIPATSVLSLTVQSGDYKGVHAPSMLDGVHSSGTQGTWKGNVWTKN